MNVFQAHIKCFPPPKSNHLSTEEKNNPKRSTDLVRNPLYAKRIAHKSSDPFNHCNNNNKKPRAEKLVRRYRKSTDINENPHRDERNSTQVLMKTDAGGSQLSERRTKVGQRLPRTERRRKKKREEKKQPSQSAQIFMKTDKTKPYEFSHQSMEAAGD